MAGSMAQVPGKNKSYCQKKNKKKKKKKKKDAVENIV
jgi:hypothetical protein